MRENRARSMKDGGGHFQLFAIIKKFESSGFLSEQISLNGSLLWKDEKVEIAQCQNSNFQCFQARKMSNKTEAFKNDDELNLDDIPLNFESSDMDREQQEYFENLKRQMQLAELSQTYREKERRPATTGASNAAAAATTTGGSSSLSKDRKNGGKNRKRKYASSSKERLAVAAPDKHLPAKTKITWRVADSKYEATTAFTTGSGTVKVRLPANHQNATSTTTASTTISAAAAAIKRKKNGSGGRIFSPIERHQHNTNEQVRRIEMRQSFEELRQLVPSLLDKPKAPKVSILQEAKMYCDELFHTDLKLQNQVTALKCQQDRMRQSLSQLRRYAAATRH